MEGDFESVITSMKIAHIAADLMMLLEHKHAEAVSAEISRRRETASSGANDHDVVFFCNGAASVSGR